MKKVIIKKRTLLALVLIFNIPYFSYAGTATKSIMKEVLENYLKLVPFMYSDANTTDKNASLHLFNLEQSFLKANHDKMLKGSNFSPSLDIINQSVQEIRHIHDNGGVNYSKHRSRKLMSVCISCHSQLPKHKYPEIYINYDKTIKKYVRTNYEKAMFALFLRDYENAIIYFKNNIIEKKSTNKRDETLESSLYAVLKIYLINLNDENKAKSYFSKIIKLKNLPTNMKDDISQWLVALSRKDRFSNKINFTESELKSAIRKELSPLLKRIMDRDSSDIAVVLLRAKRALSQFIVNKPKSELTPEILYWMGLIENQENNLSLYSLGELYHRECVTKYPKSSAAKKCFKAYEDSITWGFTGSAGTFIPADITKDLIRIKKLLNNPKEKK